MLTALTLLIVESNSKEKNIIIDLVMNFLNSVNYKIIEILLIKGIYYDILITEDGLVNGI